ncbi:MAG: hypothetical protein P9L93_01300 [Candidatus Gorgyraea atricola]|nr:hypothetical protein [Candidatus Gorgyraea atricola]
MILYLIGISYKEAPLSLRESIYRARKEIIEFWQKPGRSSAALFTCNRVELYGASLDIFSAAKTIESFQIRFPWISERSYVKFGDREVVEHALRLACGLESQVIGEEEILEQLNSWIRQASFPLALRRIWNDILGKVETIRIKSGLKEVKANIATIIFKDLDKPKEIVIVGTGKIARVFSKNKPDGINLNFVARKKHKQARQLANQSGGRAILLDDLEQLLLSADVLISATSSPHYVLKKEHFLNIVKKRNKPIYLYDLAAPRDIEPDVGNIPGIFLQNLDDLNIVFEQHKRSLNSYIKKAELLVQDHYKENDDVYSYQNRGAAEPVGVKTG